jgi:hypothetical protein
MADSQFDYPKIINRVSHLLALLKEGKRTEIVDQLVLTVLGVDGLTVSSPEELQRFMNESFGVGPHVDEIDHALGTRIDDGSIIRDLETGILTLAPAVRADIESRVAASAALEDAVRDEWLETLPQDLRPTSKQEQVELWKCLMGYTARAFLRHGAETILLLDPYAPSTGSVGKSLTSLLDESCQEACVELNPQVAVNAVELFFRRPTPRRSQWLAELLDGTFTFFALSVDEETSKYLVSTIAPKKVFLDTNFIFGVLGLNDSPVVDVSNEVLAVARDHGIPLTFCYHPVTLDELRRTLDAVGARIKGRDWRQELSRAAVRVGQLSGLERRYHEANARVPTDPDIFLSKFDDLRTLLDGYGFNQDAGS